MKCLRPRYKKGKKGKQSNGLVAVIVLDSKTKLILMLAHANEKAFCLTLATGIAHFWSRSRRRIWKKGETSGNILKLVGAPLVDCDGDAIIYIVEPLGPTCHTNQQSCFYRNVFETAKAAFPTEHEELQMVDYEVHDRLVGEENINEESLPSRKC